MRNLKLLAAGLCAIALTLGAVACSDDDDSPDSTGSTAATQTTSAATTSEAASNTFPVTIEHKFGSTTIEEQPERIVAVGFNEQDNVLALEATPLAVRDWWNDQPYATWVWARDELGTAEPLVLSSGELDVEAIASLNPDLILGFYGGLTQEEYDLLSNIAPTLVQPEEYIDYGMPWDEQTLLTGEAMGKSALAEQLVADINGQFTAAREEHPEFTDRTIVMGGSNGDGTYWIYGPEDPRSRFLSALGFGFSQPLADVADGAFYAILSAEQANLFDIDLLLWGLEEGETEESFKQDPIFSQLDVVKDDRVIFIDWDSDVAGAISFSTVLSLPYAIDEMVPMLAEKAANLE